MKIHSLFGLVLLAASSASAEKGEAHLSGAEEMGKGLTALFPQGPDQTLDTEVTHQKTPNGSSTRIEFVGRPVIKSCNQMPIFTTGSGERLPIQEFAMIDPSALKYEVIPTGARKFVTYYMNKLIFEPGPAARVVFHLRHYDDDGKELWTKWIADLPDCAKATPAK